MTDPAFVPFKPYVPDLEPLVAARRFHDVMQQRRSVRFFSDRPVPRELVQTLVATAGSAPSGANKQPWRFVAVDDPALKSEIRAGAEQEEHEFYTRRASQTWLDDLSIVGTDEHKPFLEIAPWLVVVFKLMKDDSERTPSDQVYYVNESVGIACGMFLAAAQEAGLVTLTHTPSPMKFLGPILGRPEHERPYLLIPLGYPTDDCVVPDIERKPIDEILVWNKGSSPDVA